MVTHPCVSPLCRSFSLQLRHATAVTALQRTCHLHSEVKPLACRHRPHHIKPHPVHLFSLTPPPAISCLSYLSVSDRMYITALALSTLGFASLASAHNGNHPLILNDRTGLAPVVYDGFTTSYTSTHAPVHHGVSVPLTPSSVGLNVFIKSTASVQCWRNGYPCGSNMRSQRRAAEFAHATLGVARRVPPPEFFSTRTDVPLPGHTKVPDETGDDQVYILPISTSSPSGQMCDRATDKDCFDILPIPSTFLARETSDAPPSISATCDDCFDVLPIPSSRRRGPVSSSLAPTTAPPSDIAIPTSWWRGPEGTGIPTSWWRDPEGNGIPTSWWRDPIPSQRPSHIPLSKKPNDGWPTPIDCNFGECWLPTVLPSSVHPTPSLSEVPTTPHPSCAQCLPQRSTTVDKARPEAPQSEGPHLGPPQAAGVPIDWWRGPGQPISPDATGPVLCESYITITATASAPLSTDDCFRHYCPSWASTTKQKPTSTTLEIVPTPTHTAEPVTTLFPAVPPEVTEV